MNSAELPVRFQSSTENSPWENVRRIYRRICLLRATGREEDAAALEHGGLAQALSAARIAADGEIDEGALLAQEAERVSNASILAELAVPLLVDQLRAEIASLALRIPAAAVTPAPPAPVVTPAKPTRGPAETVPAIADLIEGMLSQQSGPSSPRGSPLISSPHASA